MTIVQTKVLVSGLVKPKKERTRKTAPARKPSVDNARLSDYGAPEHSDAFSRIGAALDEELRKCPTQAWNKKLMNRVIGYLQGIRGTK